MKFQVTILGSGAALPTLNQNPTSQYVICNDRHILIDCGEGTQTQLRRNKIHIQKINHILISHLHGDHFFGLVGLLSTLHLLGRDKGLTIYGPKGLKEIVMMQLEVGEAKINFQLHFIELSGSENMLLFEDRLIEIWTFPLNHRVPTNGFLIKEKPKERKLNAELFDMHKLSLALIPQLKSGKDAVLDDGTIISYKEFTFEPLKIKTYAYCSDTKYDERTLQYIQDVDLLYHEATFCNTHIERAKQTFHSTAEQAATIAKMAKARKLLIGHLSSRYEDETQHLIEARKVFAETYYAKENTVFDV